MTGLPEYRNGGLLLDLGLLEAKHSGVTGEPHRPEEEASAIVFVSANQTFGISVHVTSKTAKRCICDCTDARLHNPDGVV